MIENLTSDIAPKVFFGHHLNVYLIALIWAKSQITWTLKCESHCDEICGIYASSIVSSVQLLVPAKNDDSDEILQRIGVQGGLSAWAYYHRLWDEKNPIVYYWPGSVMKYAFVGILLVGRLCQKLRLRSSIKTLSNLHEGSSSPHAFCKFAELRSTSKRKRRGKAWCSWWFSQIPDWESWIVCLQIWLLESVFFGDDLTVCFLQRHRASGGTNTAIFLLEQVTSVLAGQWCRWEVMPWGMGRMRHFSLAH